MALTHPPSSPLRFWCKILLTKFDPQAVLTTRRKRNYDRAGI